ncbi:MAG TPA: UDP-N-acetylmuramoylalanyl-D-glutamyl-2,6-diaminopimelate--D-alanyl-D-alanine ligase [Rhodospirillaceae bacterium]|nr:UDP-N-acetylmuramoylalanyl-D-glutamyl-2,6-diaminopimelate--D-alanyl-D-alanine ligase [Rhodospirillaceae bacterium]
MQLNWQAENVLRAVRGQSLHVQDWQAHGLSIDSRSVQKGDLFIAIKGPSLDGHDYVHHAFENGAVAAIVSQQPSQVPPDVPLIHVDDTLTALQDLGRVNRARTGAKIIAVTGSVGKTSCKEQLRLMLGAINDTYANEGSLNNHWGVPLSLARMPADTKYGIFELGMNHKDELAPLSRDVQPAIALITNVEAVHLEFFNSVEEIADAKAEIFLGMNPDGIAVLNHDSPHYARLIAAARTQGLKKTLSFGHSSKCDARIQALEPDEAGTNVEAIILGQKVSYRVGAAGVHLAINALGTLLACAALGVDLEICSKALSSYRTPERRGTRQTITSTDGGSLTLIDETFNASPIANHAALNVLGQASVHAAGRRIAILGDMLELGEKSPEMHAGLAQTLEENKIDVVHCCGEMMTHLYHALPPDMRGTLAPNSTELAQKAAATLHAGDVVMVKGSKGSHMEIIVEEIKKLGTSARHKAAS